MMIRRKNVRVKQALPLLNQNVPGLSGPESSLSEATNNGPFTSKFSLLERFGGLDGIMTTVGHVQKLYGMYQQLNSMIRAFSSLGAPKAAISNSRGNRVQTAPRKTQPKRSRAASRKHPKRG
ncbi:hypothetical protein [Paenibacillus apiarius]|uniref:Uncharacterized protein n=1 Tax=Paenibacillus apiarius TaxID=46240 RepID=A0ABT4DQK8_9BACL|nr:hypothetical protein [Paenibacillus apiarius]MCY9513392.1 hypothetical protein [Paenibacillus apiarius]MCY9519636.1 hypothetical protein [Paenibacillus apiarius]MCY9553308.1 hypothetical protein [Paenibacillus apiarius]MCY9557158.1 hypothetical protein [Paenibacillus apiarius]MCY9682101.1 hypothetical protein [Paenibacillus apiarius]